MNLNTVEIKAFVPATDFDRSCALYEAVGFADPWHHDALTCFHHGAYSFLLHTTITCRPAPRI